jgi:hypothetical protein
MMLRSVRRRITILERSIPVPLTAAIFSARVEKHAHQTGASWDTAFQSLISKVSDDELDRLATEFERLAFGDDIAARDAAKRAFFAGAGYPDWTSPPVAESRDEGW